MGTGPRARREAARQEPVLEWRPRSPIPVRQRHADPRRWPVPPPPGVRDCERLREADQSSVGAATRTAQSAQVIANTRDARNRREKWHGPADRPSKIPE